MKKKMTLMIVAAGLFVVAIVGGSIAYFTADTRAKNCLLYTSLGKEEGILEVKRDCVLMIFKKEFPYEDTHFLENLSIEQYDAIMKLLSENGSLEQIHEVLKK